MTQDPYLRDDSLILEPPISFVGKLKYLGPGFILSASIVGSGELIATTTLGAKAGFATLWVILLSCFVKVAIQLEFGRHTIQTGETVMQAFSHLPGPRFGRANWSVWTWLLLQIPKMLQVGGIIGLVAVVMEMCFPTLSLQVWGWSLAFVVAALVFWGRYSFIESLSLVLIALFSLLTISAVIALQWTPYAFNASQIMSGLRFHLPEGALLYAVGAFGITGVGGDEIMYYNYWLIEKGYAAYTGNHHADDEAWTRRARGWIDIMYVDALLSMLVYTLVTAAFYVLGAAVLHVTFVAQKGEVPENNELVAALSNMYTETLGGWAGSLFMFGAFIVLFSTLFAALASWTRIFTDAFNAIGLIDATKPGVRRRSIGLLSWLFPFAWCAVYFFFKAPGFMVIVGGASTSVLLLVVLLAAYHFRYRRCLPELNPGGFYKVVFNISGLAIIMLAIVSVYRVFL